MSKYEHALEEELSSVANGFSALLACVVETAGALSAVGIPVLLLVFSCAVAFGALGETGLSLVWTGVQSVGFTGVSFALVLLAAVGHVSADAAVWVMDVEGEAAGVVAVTAGATASAVISSVVAVLIGQKIREHVDGAVERISALIALTDAWSFLSDMGVPVEMFMVGIVMAALMDASGSSLGFLAGAGLGFCVNVSKRRNRRGGGGNRMDERGEEES
ncbi:hypothetical protein IRJ41_001933 [Triplophysa rosa]|uniref:Uncharacterized protein n=1 Tax=Triplophysa rosa TaxID=992332 RepID=A0A9W7WYA6_TRIRA|nr:hypothetical protein IRJ41_001933 [Triplophysa rosa]